MQLETPSDVVKIPIRIFENTTNASSHGVGRRNFRTIFFLSP